MPARFARGRYIFSINANPTPVPRLQHPHRQQMAIEIRSLDLMLPPDHEGEPCGLTSVLDLSVARVRNWGLYQVVVRGLEKVRAVVLLLALAHNVRQTHVLRSWLATA